MIALFIYIYHIVFHFILKLNYENGIAKNIIEYISSYKDNRTVGRGKVYIQARDHQTGSGGYPSLLTQELLCFCLFSSMKETMYCPSSRLIAKVKMIYFGDNVQNSQVRHNTLHLTSTLNLNQEPIIFQVGGQQIQRLIPLISIYHASVKYVPLFAPSNFLGWHSSLILKVSTPVPCMMSLPLCNKTLYPIQPLLGQINEGGVSSKSSAKLPKLKQMRHYI